MERTKSRRRFLTHAALPALATVGRAPSAGADETPRADERWLNFYMYGPFAFVVHKDKDPHVKLLAACIEDHSIATLSTSLSETPLPCGDWKLELGSRPANGLDPDFGQGDHVVNAGNLQLKIDPDKKRYFSLRLPMPESIWPLRPLSMKIGETTLAKDRAPDVFTATPVGLLARYKISATAKPKVDTFEPQFSGAETDQPSLFLEYRPKHDEIDCEHRHAKRAFARLLELFPPLKRSLEYPEEHFEELSPCDRTCPGNIVPATREHIRFGVGHNCRSPVLIVMNPTA